MREDGSMKTTIELPDSIFRGAKALAAVQGITLRQFIAGAVEQQLRRLTTAEPPWMSGFGRLSDLGDEHRLVLDAIEEEFERLTPDDIR